MVVTGVSADPDQCAPLVPGSARHRRPAMKRHPVRLLVLVLASAFAALALTAPAEAATTPYCGITWGSLAKQAGNSAPGGPGTELSAVRAGRHTCYDRLVLD